MGKEPFPVDRGWAWAIVAGSFVCVFFMVGTAKSTGLFLTEFQSYFGVPTSLAAMMMGGASIVYAILAPVCIMLGQTFSVRKVILCGATIGFVGMSLGSLLFSMEYVIVTFGICFGIGNASLYGNVLVILGIYFHRYRTLANGLALTGASIGQFLMPPFIEFLLETYGLQGCLLLVGGVYCHVLAAASLFRPPSFWAIPEEQETCLVTSIASQDDSTGAIVPTAVSMDICHRSKCSLINGTGGLKNGSASVDEVDIGMKVADDMSSKEETPSSTPLVTIKEVGFADDTLVESSSRKLMYRSFMASNGSFCLRPLSVYGSSVLNEPHELQVEEWEDREDSKDSFSRKLVDMFDFRLLQSYIALFIIVTNFLSFFGYFNFILFLPATVLSRGITKYDKAILVSVCGIGDLVGRLSTAIIGDRNFITRYKLQAIGIILFAVNMGGFIFADNLAWMLVHCALYGIFGGVYVSLAAVVIIDFVGLKKMPRLLAVVMLIQGIGASVGQPLLGGIRDTTGSFTPVVTICFLTSLLGGALLLLYPFVLRLEFQRPELYRLMPEPPVETCIS